MYQIRADVYILDLNKLAKSTGHEIVCITSLFKLQPPERGKTLCDRKSAYGNAITFKSHTVNINSLHIWKMTKGFQKYVNKLIANNTLFKE